MFELCLSTLAIVIACVSLYFSLVARAQTRGMTEIEKIMDDVSIETMDRLPPRKEEADLPTKLFDVIPRRNNSKRDMFGR